MTVRTWNELVIGFTFMQAAFCIALFFISNSVPVQGAAMTWLVIGCPCMFGFVINED